MSFGPFTRRRRSPVDEAATPGPQPGAPDPGPDPAADWPEPLRRAITQTLAALWWERIARAFWPLGVLACALVSALAFGLADLLAPRALGVVGILAALGIVLGLIDGLRRLRPPGRAEAMARVDATLPGRPLAALCDSIALGALDPGARALWWAHRQRMARLAAAARPVGADAGLRWRDPLGLRLAAGVALAMALIFAPPGRLGQGLVAMAASLRPGGAGSLGPMAPAGPSWEGWAEPPGYTRRPAVYLNALPGDAALTLPAGSRVTLRLYEDGLDPAQDIGEAVPGGDPMVRAFLARRDGTIRVAGWHLPVRVLPDTPPVLGPPSPAPRRADGRFLQPFTARDDHGIVAGRAVIEPDLAALDRRFGLAAAPEPRAPLDLALTLPPPRPGEDVRGQLAADLSRHPWANLPVTLRLRVEDGIGQQAVSAPVPMLLPGRRFFDPLAAALIEQRRDLLWSRANAAGTAGVLRAILWQPEGAIPPELLAPLQGVITTLEAGSPDPATRDRLAETLWQAAVAVEDGGLSDALARMERAQERLSEAIRNGANPDEIARLMDELRAATDAYTDMLARQAEDPASRFDRSPRHDQRITGDQIARMMDEIQRLMNEGRMAEAAELLDQFNRMMQNMRVTRAPGEGRQGEAEDGAGGAMQGLADMLRRQQRLADDAMRRMQQQFPGGPGSADQDGASPDGAADPAGRGAPDGQDNPPGPQGQGTSPAEPDLADRQRALREELGRQRGLLPGGSGAGTEAARRGLDRAGQAMADAERALREDDPARAMEGQARAIEGLREGMRALAEGARGAERQAGAPDAPPSPGAPDGAPGEGRPGTDPLGRDRAEGNGASASNDPLAPPAPDAARRARDLQDEIRRRSGDPDRPRAERDYLGRLLERF